MYIIQQIKKFFKSFSTSTYHLCFLCTKVVDLNSLRRNSKKGEGANGELDCSPDIAIQVQVTRNAALHVNYHRSTQFHLLMHVAIQI